MFDKFSKKLVASLMAAGMVFAFAACGGESTEETADESVAATSLPTEIAQADWVDAKQYAELSTGVTMAYIEMGDAKGEPVVLIHGGSGDTSRTFSLMAPYLAEAGYHLYLVDRKANGDSSAPEYGTYDMWGEAADIAAFIDAMGYEKAHIAKYQLKRKN